MGRPARKRLGELLITSGVIDDVQLQRALAEQKHWGGQLGQVLVSLQFCSEEAIVQALSTQLGLDAVKLDGRAADAAALRLLPADFCRQNDAFPVAFQSRGKLLDVALADPTRPGLVDEIRVRTQANPRPLLAGADAIQRAIRLHYLGDRSADTRSLTIQRSGATPPPNIGGTLPPESPRGRVIELELPATDPERIKAVEARLARAEQAVRALLKLLVDAGIVTREELKARLTEE